MRAGKLDRKITLKKKVTTEDPDYPGSTIEAYSAYATVWCGVKYLRGAEDLESAQVVDRQDVVFSVRYRTDVSITDEIDFEGQPFRIWKKEEEQRRKGLFLTAKAIVEGQ